MQDSLEEQARRYATQVHAESGQRRKYTDEPYIVHPTAVVELVRSVTDDPVMLAAAWLHDTVEDTATTLNDIENHFGPEVARLVEMLTDTAPTQAKIGLPEKWRISVILPRPVLKRKLLSWPILLITHGPSSASIRTSPAFT